MKRGGAVDLTSEPHDRIGIGPHAAWTEGTDVVHVAWKGDVLPEHILALGKLIAAMPDAERGVFLVQRMPSIGRFTPGARKTITTDPSSRFVREVVILGASFHMRVLMTMIDKAMSVFRRANAPMVFCESEAEAMEHVAQKRREQPRGNVG